MIPRDATGTAGDAGLDLRKLGEMASLESYPEGHLFFRPGQPATTLYLILDGQVRLYHALDGSRHIVTNYLARHSFFGAAMLRCRPHYLTAEAATPVEVLAIRETDIARLQEAAPDLVAQLALDLIRQLEHIERVYTRTPLTTPARLAGLLLLLMDREARLVGNVSHHQLAEMLGTHREFVTQTLASFREEGIVETGYRRIAILDPERLRSVAGG